MLSFVTVDTQQKIAEPLRATFQGKVQYLKAAEHPCSGYHQSTSDFMSSTGTTIYVVWFQFNPFHLYDWNSQDMIHILHRYDTYLTYDTYPLLYDTFPCPNSDSALITKCFTRPRHLQRWPMYTGDLTEMCDTQPTSCPAKRLMFYFSF